MRKESESDCDASPAEPRALRCARPSVVLSKVHIQTSRATYQPAIEYSALLY